MPDVLPVVERSRTGFTATPSARMVFRGGVKSVLFEYLATEVSWSD